MTNWKSYASIGAAVAAVVAGGYFSAVANAQSSKQTATSGAKQAQTGPHPTRIMGKVSAVGPNSVTLTTRQGDVTANVGPNTWVVVRKNNSNSQGSISDLVKDKVAFVAGMTTSDPKVVDARVVTEGAKLDGSLNRSGKGKAQGNAQSKGLAGHTASGTVKSVNGSTLTVTTNKGKDVDVATTADTVVLNNGFQSVNSIKAGDKVQVLGTTQRKDKTAPVSAGNVQVNAWALRVENAGTQLSRGHIAGPVSGNTFTLKTAKNPAGLTVNVTANTAYKTLNVSPTDHKASLGNAAQADLKGDSNVVVDGTLSADGKTLNATAVIILPTKAAHKS